MATVPPGSIPATLIDALPMSAAILDGGGRVAAVNRHWRRFARINGLEWADAGVGSSYPDVCRAAVEAGERSAVEALTGLQAVLAGKGADFSMEYYCQTPSGDMWFTLIATRFEADGHPWVLVCHQDVSEARRAETAHHKLLVRMRELRRIDRAILNLHTPADIAQSALSHLRFMIPFLRASLVLFDLKQRTFTVLAAHTDRHSQIPTGKPLPLDSYAADLEDLRSGTVWQVADITRLPDPPATMQQMAREGVRAFAAIPLMVRQRLIGSLNIGWESSADISAEHLDIAGDISDSMAISIYQARLFRTLHRQHRNLRALARRMTDIETLERKRLARELHDQVGQNLTALNINLGLIRQLIDARGQVTVAERFDDCQGLIRSTVTAIRNLIDDLRPEVLDDYGLAAALRQHAEKYEQRTGIAVVVNESQDLPRPSPAVENHFFQIACEALTNVAKHAGATTVTITLGCRRRRFWLVVRDDGCGPGEAALAGAAGGRGLTNMRERMLMLGGRMILKRSAGGGTRLTFTVKE